MFGTVFCAAARERVGLRRPSAKGPPRKPNPRICCGWSGDPFLGGVWHGNGPRVTKLTARRVGILQGQLARMDRIRKAPRGIGALIFFASDLGRLFTRTQSMSASLLKRPDCCIA